jgi:GTP pyrophosphokinase
VLAALEPEAHAVLRSWVAHRPEWRAYTDGFITRAIALMRAEKIGANVVARPKHLYTIWKDMVAQDRTELYEPPRIAIIVTGAENDCYTVLGAVHSQWRPVPGRFKDFIASPKNNLYRSLHTTVVGPDGHNIEPSTASPPRSGSPAGDRVRTVPGAARGGHAGSAASAESTWTG